MKTLLTSKQAAEYLGYSEQTLRASRKDGGLLGGIVPPAHIKIGKKTVRYSIDELERWVKAL